MPSLRLFVVTSTLLAFVGCAPDLCDRSKSAGAKTQGDCPAAISGPLLGSSCSAQISACSEADQKLLSDAVACSDKLTTCSSIAVDAWRLQQNACTNALSALSQPCADAFFQGNQPGVDAGQPDAGVQPVTDGGNGIVLLAASSTEVDGGEPLVALAWESLRTADVAQWLLVEFDGVGENRKETALTPGTLNSIVLRETGSATRQYFIAGLNANGDVLQGMAATTMVVDAGSECQGPNDCMPSRVCDLGRCTLQTCVSGGANTCPSGYACSLASQCSRTSDDGGTYIPPSMSRDAGSQPLPMVSNLITVSPRPPTPSMPIEVGGIAATAGDIAALDSARVFVALEQDAQLIAHPSTARGDDLSDEVGTSFGIDTTGARMHVAWPSKSSVFACYVVGRSVRIQKSDDRGRTWGRNAISIDPPMEADGGFTGLVRDCDIASWKNGGVIVVTAEEEVLKVREISPELAITSTTTAFTSIPPDAGNAAVYFPSRPSIAGYAPTDGGLSNVFVTFTGSRIAGGGASDTEPYGVVQLGGGSFSNATRMTPTTLVGGTALPEDYTSVTVHPETGMAIGAFTTIEANASSNSTVYLAVYSVAARTWSTGSHLNVFVNNAADNTGYVLPEKSLNATWFAYSPQVAPLPGGKFALSFVAGPKDSQGVGDYHQYFVRFDPERIAAVTNAKGWFMPPATKVSPTKVLDPRGTSTAPQPSVTALGGDGQISVYGAFVEGVGVQANIPGPAQYWHWP